MTRTLSEDDRGTSESAGVAVLVLFTIIVTASVGVGVLFVDQDDSVNAEFSYDYFEERTALLITYESGQSFRASNVVVDGPGPNMTWNEIGPLNASSTLEPGAYVQLARSNDYGHAIREYDTVRLVRTGEGNATLLSQWNSSSG